MSFLAWYCSSCGMTDPETGGLPLGHEEPCVDCNGTAKIVQWNDSGVHTDGGTIVQLEENGVVRWKRESAAAPRGGDPRISGRPTRATCAIMNIAARKASGVALDAAARAFIRAYPDMADQLAEDLGSWPSSEPELAAFFQDAYQKRSR